ncbi:hypothetical protein OEZ86_004732 [Tetradesmus obliquus]|uniref:Uncharacterized protein n=1 Tax=Tetradesmus obliquus TaxID=3088 RepID=A0A383W360_TETOB|nr:hypothetical protein OEZ86_004732 [Tetradesmus obliquus]|eukprot:jgi/Sobl393_1/8770/SZX71464.1
MAPTKEQSIAIGAAATVVAGVVALGIYNREKTQQLASASYSRISETASAAATKTSEGFKAVQAAAANSVSSVSKSATATWEGMAKKMGMKRVKSFPIIPDEEDVAAVVDQSSKAAKKAAKKVAQQMEKAGVSVQATA